MLTHGLSDLPEFSIWCGIIKRCRNQNSLAYANYGGRGIDISNEWRRDFKAFYDHVGPRPTPDHSIDRIDNRLGYYPGNVRWATRKQQCRNKRGNHLAVLHDVTRTIAEWSEITGIPYRTIMTRLRDGWSDERALSEPQKAYTTRFSKSNNRMVEFNGEKLALMQWARKTGIAFHTLKYRLNAGWPIERVFMEPVKKKNFEAAS